MLMETPGSKIRLPAIQVPAGPGFVQIPCPGEPKLFHIALPLHQSFVSRMPNPETVGVTVDINAGSGITEYQKPVIVSGVSLSIVPVNRKLGP
jgi:hypothetical protein